ncbi:MAG: Flagellar hook-associated protein 1 [Planctomycetota bacterium]|jgi:flagellar hook-associated protein 1 FlgK
MTIFGFIQQSSAALKVAELGIQIVGNNVANANTPGYIRQELVQQSAIGMKIGQFSLGYGVRATGVVQKVDSYLNERMRTTQSEMAKTNTLLESYTEFENFFSELSSEDISTSMSEFANAFNDLTNQPGSDSLRTMVIERGKSLASEIRDKRTQMLELSQRYGKQITLAADEINRITKQIGVLNTKIAEIEGSIDTGTQAVGLRDERLQLLEQLAGYISIKTSESETGTVSVFIGGDYLVADGISRTVAAAQTSGEGRFNTEIILTDSQSALKITGGSIGGMIEARDRVIQGTLDQYDEFTKNLIDRVNFVHSQGQGAKGFSAVTSSRSVSSSSAVLEDAGLSRTVENGGFQIKTLDANSGLERTYDIPVQLDGLPTDTNLFSLAQSISNIPGLSAIINELNQIEIKAIASTTTFSFQNDTSGALAALGINTFFSGEDSSDIDINDVLKKDPSLLAVSLDGVGRTTRNANILGEIFESPIPGLGDQSLRDQYEALAIRMTQDSNIEKGKNEGFKSYFATLESKHLGQSGVNLDEEAVKLMLYQKAYQASSRVIAISNELLTTLMQI